MNLEEIKKYRDRWVGPIDVKEKLSWLIKRVEEREGFYLPIDCPFCSRHRLYYDMTDDGPEVECEKCEQKNWELEDKDTIWGLQKRVDELEKERSSPCIDTKHTFVSQGDHYKCAFCEVKQ